MRLLLGEGASGNEQVWLPQIKPAFAAKQRADKPSLVAVGHLTCHGVGQFLNKRNILMVLAHEPFGLLRCHIQLLREPCLPHAVHDAEVDGLGGGARDVGDIGHHLVEIGFRVGAVCLDEIVGPGQALVREACKVDKDTRLLLIKIQRRPLLALFRQEQPAYLSCHVWIASGDLLQVGVGHRNAPGYGAAAVRP